MPETTTRDQIREAIDRLPPDATFEDAIERLVFLAKIEAGLAELDARKEPTLKSSARLIWTVSPTKGRRQIDDRSGAGSGQRHFAVALGRGAG